MPGDDTGGAVGRTLTNVLGFDEALSAVVVV